MNKKLPPVQKFTVYFLIFFLYSICFAQSELSEDFYYQSKQSEFLSLDGTWYMQSEDEQSTANIQVPGEIGEQAAKLVSKFELPESWRKKRILLKVTEIQPHGSIEINGQFVTDFNYGTNAFSVVLKNSWLKFGATNSITVSVDHAATNNERFPLAHQPLLPARKNGILGSIQLVAKPIISVELKDLQSQIDLDKKQATLSMNFDVFASRAEFENPDDAKGRVQIALHDGNRRLAYDRLDPFEFDGLNKFFKNIQLQVPQIELWSPASPKMYQLELQLEVNNQIVENVRYNIGLREVTLQNRKLWLNGSPFPLKGVNLIDPFHGLADSMLAASIRYTVNQCKRLGANVVRIVGGPSPQQFISSCDNAGIFVLEEIPIYFMNNTQLADKEKLQRARIALQNTIQRDKLHPSILAWGFGINHDDMSQSGGEYIAQLADEAHAVDGRPVYLVTRSRGINPNLAPVDFILYDNFEREQMAFDPTWFEEKPVLPIIGFLEKDYLVSPEVTEPQRIENETEEIQAEKIENLLRFFTENWPDYAGHFIHAYQDWYGKSPSSLAGANADSTQLTAGILRDDGTPKVLFNMLSAYYNGERRPHISPSEMTPEHPFEFTFVGITAILVFLFFWRRDKRLSGNMRRVFVHPHGFYMDLYENRKVPGFITSIVALAEGIVWALLLASTFHALKENLIFDEVLSLLLPNPELKAMFISLIWNPVNMLIFIVVSYVFIGLILGFLFRILGFIFGQSIPIGQYVAFVFWAAVSYLPLALLTPIFYRFLLEEQALTYALSVIGFFILWHLMRLYRGLRVMLVLPPGRAFLLFVGVLVVIAGSIVFYYEHTQSILGYVGYYWRLMN